MKALCVAVALLMVNGAALAASYRELQTIMEGPWRAAKAPAKPQRLAQDHAGCRVIAMQTPQTSTTPAVIEAVQWGVEINCLNALGYISAGQMAVPK